MEHKLEWLSEEEGRIAFFENGIIMNDSDQINDNCTVCWIDKKGNKNDELKVIIKE